MTPLHRAKRIKIIPEFHLTERAKSEGEQVPVVCGRCRAEGSVNVITAPYATKRTLPLLLLSEINWVDYGSWKDSSAILKNICSSMSILNILLQSPFSSVEKSKKGKTLPGFTRNTLFGTVCLSTRQHPIHISSPCTLFSTCFNLLKLRQQKIWLNEHSRWSQYSTSQPGLLKQSKCPKTAE